MKNHFTTWLIIIIVFILSLEHTYGTTPKSSIVEAKTGEIILTGGWTYTGFMMSWEVLSEKNASHFNIQASMDGIIWDDIGEVKVNHSLGEKAKYEYLITYVQYQHFRLVVHNTDGSLDYLNVVGNGRKNNISKK